MEGREKMSKAIRNARLCAALGEYIHYTCAQNQNGDVLSFQINIYFKEDERTCVYVDCGYNMEDWANIWLL